jgi:hypothetical protein
MLQLRRKGIPLPESTVDRRRQDYIFKLSKPIGKREFVKKLKSVICLKSN